MPAETTTTAGPVTGPTVTVRCQFCLTWNRLDATRIADRPKCGKCAKPILLDRPLKLDSETFARTVADSQIPVFVDFYADWCGPCKMMAPAVDALAAKYTGKAIVAKLDTDHAPAISQQFGIRGIPTSIVFTGGKEAARASGALPLAQLEAMLTPRL
jgi:thioredoxin 2